MKKIEIIGAGLSSVYAACFLAKNGYSVEIFEKNSMYRGRYQFFKANEFTFDMGPSWYWMPELVDDLFTDLGEKRTYYFQLTRLDPAYQVLLKDRTSIQISVSKKDLISLFEPNGGDKLIKFLADVQTKYEIATEQFPKNLGLRIDEITKFSVLKNALKLDMFKSVEKDNFQGLGRIYFPEIDIKGLSFDDKKRIETEIQLEFDDAYIGIKQLPKASRLRVYFSYAHYTRLLCKIKRKTAKVLMQCRVRVPNNTKFYLFAKSHVQNSMNLL